MCTAHDTHWMLVGSHPRPFLGQGRQSYLLGSECWHVLWFWDVWPLSVASGVRWHFCFHPFVQQVCFWDWQVTRYCQVFKRWTAPGRPIRCQFSLAARKCHVTGALRPLPHCSCEGVSLRQRSGVPWSVQKPMCTHREAVTEKWVATLVEPQGFRQWSAS